MKKTALNYFIVAGVCMCYGTLFAQFKFFNPKESFAIETSLPNTKLIRMPMYRNAITSLAVKGDYILGGTNAHDGLTPFIFTASLQMKSMVHLYDLNEKVKGQRGIITGFNKGGTNIFYAGTMALKENDGSPGSGHLIQVEVNEDGTLNVQDLGSPIPGESIFSMLCNADGTLLYGITYPSGIFYKYNVKTNEIKEYKDLIPSDKDLETLKSHAILPENYLGKALIEDDKGFIYGSLPINKIFRFDPQKESFEILDSEIPEVWGRRALGQIESWAKAKDGTLYGGNTGDGQLFILNPQTLKIKNLGKPIMMNRLKGLTFAKDGKLYGIAGGPPGYSHLFSYDELNEGFHDMGNPEFEMVAPGIEQGILWRGFRLETITASEDGKYIIMGEDEDLSQLLIFAVGEVEPGRIGF
ncbi:hypothetical protein [Mariniflexile sp. HMF6888]|uniref:hypothetical protein n=1 Tax=Mariniflexile sp. HMF6888 TaxID=3373086 RepID=UPI0037AF69A2